MGIMEAQADRNFKGPFYTLRHVRCRLKRDTGVLERGLRSVSDIALLGWAVLGRARWD